MSDSAVSTNVPLSGLGRFPWLFSPWLDLSAFLGSAIVALGLLGVGAGLGILHSDSPEWTWVTAVLLVDVAHVYATGFRVLADREELRRRKWLYGLTPLLAFALGWAVHSESQQVFWRVLAYLAVFHFVRQQYGWVALYRSRAGDISTAGKLIDSAAIYLATVFPLVWWHAHLPRNFWWFLNGDFSGIPIAIAAALEPVYWLSLLLYAGRSLYRGMREGQWNPGKDVVVTTTAVCWYVGIITFNSDYAFTVTNVIIHGVPYFVLVYWYWKRSAPSRGESSASRWKYVVMFVATLWLLAYAEELLWDRGVWQHRAWLFGGWDLSGLRGVLVPLLAVPQITHYILDGFIWKRRGSPEFRRNWHAESQA